MTIDFSAKALRVAVRRLIQECGGIEPARAVVGVRKSLMADYYAPAHPDRPMKHMRIDQVAALETVVGAPIVTRELARLAGYDLVPRSDHEAATGPDDGQVTQFAVPSVRASADLLQTAADADEDGRLSGAELNRLIAAAREQRAEADRVLDGLLAKQAARGVAAQSEPKVRLVPDPAPEQAPR